MIDTKAIYLRPQNNPDGSNLYLYTAQSNRSTVKPHDNDRDGLLDEDPNEDLDGDGNVNNDNTDFESELEIGIGFFSNHLDSDDDNDGTPTRDEISDENGNIIFPYPDSNGDGTPDYLDPDVN